MRINESVVVSTHRGMVEIPWDSRQALIHRLRGDDDAMSVIDAFEAAGTSRPVELEEADARVLLLEIDAWSGEAGSVAGLPAGLDDLRNALDDHGDG